MVAASASPSPDRAVELPERWITDTATSERFPHFTRANADEVAPFPISPLGWDIGWTQGAAPGVADGYVRFGITAPEEFRWPDPETFGNWGGYFYNQLSLGRLLGVRMPGASAQAIDRAYFGENPNVPPYTPDPRDENAAQTEQLVAVMGAVMGADSYPPMDDFIVRAKAMRDERPDLAAATDAELVAHARSFPPVIRYMWDVYCYVVIAASIGPGAVQAICEGIGRSEAVAGLFSALGGVESASSSTAVWDVSRIVAANPEVNAAFAAGTDGLHARLHALPADVSGEFWDAFTALLDQFGHRGPHEWDLASPSWAIDPSIALGMIERMRLRDDVADPRRRSAESAAERERLTAEVLAATADDEATRSTLQAGLRSGTTFYQLREGGKDAAVRVMYEAKLPLRELGTRLADRGDIETAEHVFMLLESELDDILTDPKLFAELLADRATVFARLHELEPPYIVSDPGAPPITGWKAQSRAVGASAAAGEVLAGIGVSPGTATGIARVIYDMGQADALEPGDVLVCSTTDPSWVPLFMTAGAVVCNVGALASHAAIVSRELGVPCAVSVPDATTRIADGSVVSVDGSTGVVTIVSTP